MGKPHMVLSVALVVVAAAMLTGCRLGGGSGAISDGRTTVVTDSGRVWYSEPRRQVVGQVEQMPIPPFNKTHVIGVACRVNQGLASCTGHVAGGPRVAADFRIQPDLTLGPVCSPNPNNNLFCMS